MPAFLVIHDANWGSGTSPALVAPSLGRRHGRRASNAKKPHLRNKGHLATQEEAAKIRATEIELCIRREDDGFEGDGGPDGTNVAEENCVRVRCVQKWWVPTVHDPS